MRHLLILILRAQTLADFVIVNSYDIFTVSRKKLRVCVLPNFYKSSSELQIKKQKNLIQLKIFSSNLIGILLFRYFVWYFHSIKAIKIKSFFLALNFIEGLWIFKSKIYKYFSTKGLVLKLKKYYFKLHKYNAACAKWNTL